MMQKLNIEPKDGIAALAFSGQDSPAPRCLMTLREKGTMRFRWNEKNPKRDQVLSALSGNTTPVAVKLCHSQKVIALQKYDSKSRIFSGSTLDAREEIPGEAQISEAELDGIITTDKNFAPVITVADCMPIFLWDSAKGCFGVLHSGWRGTGIVETAIRLAEKTYGSRAEDFCVILGPHIHDCCYTVEEERAEYFSNTFGPSCVSLGETGEDGENRYRLSLAEANRLLLLRCGVREERIACYTNCTGCDDRLGSFRRETAHLGSMDIEERTKHITVMAALIGYC